MLPLQESINEKKIIQINLPKKKIVDFCQRWLITEFALFGSVLRKDFGPDSDIDILVTFAPNARWSLFDHVDMQDELEALLERSVDLVNKRGLERSQNYLRRESIFNTMQVIYAVSR